jgi:hypothetical protein
LGWDRLRIVENGKDRQGLQLLVPQISVVTKKDLNDFAFSPKQIGSFFYPFRVPDS